MRKIVVILGHSSPNSYCSSLAERYAQSALAQGHELRWLKLHEMDFDPILHEGYRRVQALEPSLKEAQASLAWADHWVIVYPIWWGGIPALLKGFFDRVLLPGFAFKYRANSSLWDKLMAGKSAQLIVTQDTPSWYFRWIYGRPGHLQMKRTILGFCGVSPIKLYEVGPIRGSTLSQRENWLRHIDLMVKQLQ